MKLPMGFVADGVQAAGIAPFLPAILLFIALALCLAWLLLRVRNGSFGQVDGSFSSKIIRRICPKVEVLESRELLDATSMATPAVLQSPVGYLAARLQDAFTPQGEVAGPYSIQIRRADGSDQPFQAAYHDIFGNSQFKGMAIEESPWIGVNMSGADQEIYNIRWPSLAVLIHPAADRQVVTSWESPGEGTASVSIILEDMHRYWGDGASFTVEQVHEGVRTVLAQGQLPDGGLQDLLQGQKVFSVAKGDRINVVVGSGGNGDNHGDFIRSDFRADFIPLPPIPVSMAQPPSTSRFQAAVDAQGNLAESFRVLRRAANGTEQALRSDYQNIFGDTRFKGLATGESPWIGRNVSGADVQIYNIDWRKDAVLVHPAPGEGLVLQWESPMDGVADITALIKDRHGGWGDGAGAVLERVSQEGVSVLVRNLLPDGQVTDLTPQSMLVSVKKGDRINLVLTALQDNNGDFLEPNFTVTLTPNAVAKPQQQAQVAPASTNQPLVDLALLSRAAKLQEQLQFKTFSLDNETGQHEKEMLSTAENKWYALLPSGELWSNVWNGSRWEWTPCDKLSRAFYEDPTLLFTAPAEVAKQQAQAAQLSPKRLWTSVAEYLASPITPSLGIVAIDGVRVMLAVATPDDGGSVDGSKGGILLDVAVQSPGGTRAKAVGITFNRLAPTGDYPIVFHRGDGASAAQVVLHWDRNTQTLTTSPQQMWAPPILPAVSPDAQEALDGLAKGWKGQMDGAAYLQHQMLTGDFFIESRQTRNQRAAIFLENLAALPEASGFLSTDSFYVLLARAVPQSTDAWAKEQAQKDFAADPRTPLGWYEDGRLRNAQDLRLSYGQRFSEYWDVVLLAMDYGIDQGLRLWRGANTTDIQGQTQNVLDTWRMQYNFKPCIDIMTSIGYRWPSADQLLRASQHLLESNGGTLLSFQADVRQAQERADYLRSIGMRLDANNEWVPVSDQNRNPEGGTIQTSDGGILTPMTAESLDRIRRDADTAYRSAIARGDQQNAESFRLLFEAADNLLKDIHSPHAAEWIAKIEQMTTDPTSMLRAQQVVTVSLAGATGTKPAPILELGGASADKTGTISAETWVTSIHPKDLHTDNVTEFHSKDDPIKVVLSANETGAITFTLKQPAYLNAFIENLPAKLQFALIKDDKELYPSDPRASGNAVSMSSMLGVGIYKLYLTRVNPVTSAVISTVYGTVEKESAENSGPVSFYPTLDLVPVQRAKIEGIISQRGIDHISHVTLEGFGGFETDWTIKATTIDPSKSTFVVIHGREDKPTSGKFRELFATLQQYAMYKDRKLQIVVLDWRQGASDVTSITPLDEWDLKDSWWTDSVGNWAAQQLKNLGFDDFSKINLVGHSHGTYVSYFLAAFAQENFHTTVESIVALDPPLNNRILLRGTPRAIEVNFTNVARASLALHSSWLGSGWIASTAHRTLTVDCQLSGIHLIDEHGMAVGTFADILREDMKGNGSAIGQLLDIYQLVQGKDIVELADTWYAEGNITIKGTQIGSGDAAFWNTDIQGISYTSPDGKKWISDLGDVGGEQVEKSVSADFPVNTVDLEFAPVLGQTMRLTIMLETLTDGGHDIVSFAPITLNFYDDNRTAEFFITPNQPLTLERMFSYGTHTLHFYNTAGRIFRVIVEPVH